MHGPLTQKKEGLLWIFKKPPSLNYQVIRSEAAKCSASLGCMQVHLYALIYLYINYTYNTPTYISARTHAIK